MGAHGRMPAETPPIEGGLADERQGWGVGSLEGQPGRPDAAPSPADTVQRVLALARTYLRMDVAWLADPVAGRPAGTRERAIGPYVGVPVRTPDGSLRGMLCCISDGAQPELTVVDMRVLEMLASILGELAGDDARAAALETVRLRTNDAITGRGRTLALSRSSTYRRASPPASRP